MAWDAEAVAEEIVERDFQLHAGFGQPQHDVAGVAAFVADGSAGDFSFRDEGADVVFGRVGVEGDLWAFEQPVELTPASTQGAFGLLPPLVAGSFASVDLSMPDGLTGGRGGKPLSRASSSFTA